MLWFLEATLSNAVIATAMALTVVAMARFLRHRPAVIHAMWLIVLLKLVTPPLVSVAVEFGWKAHPTAIVARPGSAVELPGDVPMGDETGDRRSGTNEPLSESDVAALAMELERMRAERELQSTSTSQSWLPVLALWLVGSVIWTAFAAVFIVRFSWLLRAARPCGDDVAAIANRAARKLGLSMTPVIVTVDARIPPLVWHAGRAPRIVLPSDLVSQWSNEQLELLLAHELAHVKRGDHLVRWFTLAVLAVYWWHPVAWWAVRRQRVAEEQCCDAMVVAASPSHAHAYAETLLKTLEFLAARRLPPHALVSGIGSGGSIKRRCEMILSGQTKVRRGRIAGVLLLLVAIAVLPLAGVVRGADESNKKTFGERLRRLEQAFEKLIQQNEFRRPAAAREEQLADMLDLEFLPPTAAPGPNVPPSIVGITGEHLALAIRTVLEQLWAEGPHANIEGIVVRPGPEDRPGSADFVVRGHWARAEKDASTFFGRWISAVDARGVNMELQSIRIVPTERGNRVNFEVAGYCSDSSTSSGRTDVGFLEELTLLSKQMNESSTSSSPTDVGMRPFGPTLRLIPMSESSTSSGPTDVRVFPVYLPQMKQVLSSDAGGGDEQAAGLPGGVDDSKP